MSAETGQNGGSRNSEIQEEISNSSAAKIAKSHTKIETMRRTISPYDLSGSENPGFTISQPLLRGPNYDEWATNLRLALQSRKKFGFVDGSISPQSEESEDFDDWSANNALVISWIKLTIHESIRSNISHCDVACDLWDHIKRRFSVKSGQRVQRLKAELATCRQKGLAIEAYYGKLTQLWTSMKDYQHAKTMADVEKQREEDKVHQFLMGLDESVYGSVKSALLSRVPFPTLDEAYNVVTQDEESKITSRIFEERNEGVSFVVQSTPRNKSNVENRIKLGTCSTCGRKGHVADQCFRKIGYPAWWGERPRPTFGGSQSQPGLLPTPNTSRSVGTARANHLTTAGSVPCASANVALTSNDRIGFSGLSNT